MIFIYQYQYSITSFTSASAMFRDLRCLEITPVPVLLWPSNRSISWSSETGLVCLLSPTHRVGWCWWLCLDLNYWLNSRWLYISLSAWLDKVICQRWPPCTYLWRTPLPPPLALTSHNDQKQTNITRIINWSIFDVAFW